MDNNRRLDTVLPWVRTTRALYHFDKLAHSTLIGFALWCLSLDRVGLVTCIAAGAGVYLVAGKLIFGRDHHPDFWHEVADWFADGIIGSAACAIAIWRVAGFEAGLVACALWILAYVVFSYRFAVP